MPNVNVTDAPAQPAQPVQPAAPDIEKQDQARAEHEARIARERDQVAMEVTAIGHAYTALHRLDQAALRRAFSWLHDRLEHAEPDPWARDEPPF